MADASRVQPNLWEGAGDEGGAGEGGLQACVEYRQYEPVVGEPALP